MKIWIIVMGSWTLVRSEMTLTQEVNYSYFTQAVLLDWTLEANTPRALPSHASLYICTAMYHSGVGIATRVWPVVNTMSGGVPREFQ